MTGPLVETKLFLPAPRSGVVDRPRLSEHLARRSGRVVLVSAPAGFGKTTLLASWTATVDTVAWVSLDESDQDPSTFWTYVVTALDRASPGLGASALPLLHAGQQPTDGLLAGVVNELSVLPGEVTLVLDDYHLADGPRVRPGMTFLVDHLPPQLQLVLSTRADPALPLARLRARGELTEVRAADLRFTTGEAGAYLNDATGLHLVDEDVAVLEERTEGWVAALQLAALSLQGRDDASEFIAGFAGDDRFVVDYLLEEVLDLQPDPVRRFLLATSILDHFTGPLCDAVTGETGGKAMLEQLDRANLFLVPLDDRRRWYRYHHLFGDLLRSRLLDEHDDVADLHRRASVWHDQAGDPVPAVQHSLAAGDLDRAADLVELAVPELRRNRQERTLRQWIDQLPDTVVERRPVLAMGFVGALMSSNEFDDVGRRLEVIEQMLNDRNSSHDPARDRGRAPGGEGSAIVVVDEAELPRLPGCVELYRAGLALVGGDPAGCLAHAHLAVDLAPEGDDLTRASAAALVGLASWTLGDLQTAHRGYTDAADGLRRLGYVSDVLGCSTILADLETTQGRLRQAQRTYETALELAAGEDPRMRGIRDIHTGLAEIAVQRGDLAAAREHLRRCDELGEAAGLPRNPYRWRVALAQLRDAEGDRQAALDLLAEAEQVYAGDFAPNVRPVPAMRARVLAAHGALADALEWRRQAEVSSNDDLSYLREYEHVTLARVLLAQHNADGADGADQLLADALELLQRLQRAAEDGDRAGTVIEVLALLALARQQAGDDEEALGTLERALMMSEPEGHVQVFAGGGQPMAALLTALDRRRPGWPYVHQVLDAAVQPARVGYATGATEGGRSGQPATGGLVDPLTGRERDVLRLLASELDGPAIARELVLSLNTVRTHTKNIYAKLGVTNRRAAVARAHQLNLLSRTGSH